MRGIQLKKLKREEKKVKLFNGKIFSMKIVH